MPVIAVPKQSGAIRALRPAKPKLLHTAPVTPHSFERSISMEIGLLKSNAKKMPPPQKMRKADKNVTKSGRFLFTQNILNGRKDWCPLALFPMVRFDPLNQPCD